MSVSLRDHAALASRWPLGAATTPLLVAAGLLLASAVHLDLAVTHGLSSFAVLSLCAGVTQGVLGAAALLRPSPMVWRASIVVALTLSQLYLLNVTIGLPPLIAHTHAIGAHSFLGVTLALPNAVDLEGVVAQSGQLIAIACAAVMNSRGTDD